MSAGTAAQLNVSISGSGHAALEGVRSTAADLHLSGSGWAAVQVSETLRADVSGSGDVSVAGNPAQRDERVTGSGRITYR